MPCPACDISYTVRPCEHETGILIEKDVTKIKEFRPILYSDNAIVFHTKVYKDLHFNCPCRNCLVKATCNVEYPKRCEEYRNIIERYLVLYYDEITGMFSKKELRKYM
jgi:hypothetical protein